MLDEYEGISAILQTLPRDANSGRKGREDERPE